jgi:molybdopterin synthase sulfur carrier subunit
VVALSTYAATAKEFSVQITVRLLASYRQYLPARHDDQAGYPYQVEDNALVGDVLAALPIPPGEFYTYMVNGRHAERDQVLQDGDLLSVFPAAGGG